MRVQAADSFRERRRRKIQRRGRAALDCLLFTVLCGAVTACADTSAHPTCGWQSNIPANGDQICRATYQTLTTIVQAEVTGNNRRIQRLAPNATVADRIIRHGRQLRAQHIVFLRATKNFAVNDMGHGRFTVDAYLVGKSRVGKIDLPEEITVRYLKGKAVVIADRPEEEW